MRAPADVVDPADAIPPPPEPPPLPGAFERALNAGAGWPAIAALSVAIALLFVVGMVLTR